ncbi:probable cytochrome P450 6a14 [Colletes gigas]|uniref:probable cytochrome P450 6a14 n=1 Tax=Colletes gigas TaxID=935657 RepID=UPI001C9B1A9E|nr:probable cytochrome P450 6a14 [Colletes gigas]
MADGFLILCTIAITILTLYYYYTSTYDFWKKRGIPGPQPLIIFGNFGSLISKRISFSSYIKTIYEKYKHEPVCGIFQGSTPILIVNDLNLSKDVLIRDFSLFAHRGIPTFPKIDPLTEHLFALEPERWRPLRAKLSPVFTTGKLKEMFPLIIECAKHLEEYLDKMIKNGELVECREMAAKYTTDVIGSCAFGIEMNAFKDKNSEFRRIGKQVFTPSLQQVSQELCRQFLPRLYNIIGHLLQPKEVAKFFTNAIVGTMKYRKENNIVRPDFVNVLMELKENPEKLENLEFTDQLLTSQAFIFFLAGFETSSSTMSFVLYELAQNQHIQDKLRAEIREKSTQNGELTYNQVKEMKYLDAVFRETLRKYSILPILMRQVSEDYTFRETKITIPKDTLIWIPIYAIQNDPDIYPDPVTFNPERFTDEAIEKRHPMSFLSFGDGPRNCIGARFAHYQSKIGLISILRNHKVDVCEKTTIPFDSDPRNFLLTLKDGVTLKVTEVQ